MSKNVMCPNCLKETNLESVYRDKYNYLYCKLCRSTIFNEDDEEFTYEFI